MHDGFYGCTSGSGFSNRAFVEVLARTLPPGRLLVAPLHVPGSGAAYDPAWVSSMRQLLKETSTEVTPVPAPLGRPGAHRFLCRQVADIARDRLAGARRSQLIALDFPFLGLAPHLGTPDTELLLLPRSTTQLDAPHDHEHIRWEREGMAAAVERGGRIAAISQHMRTHLTRSYGVPPGALVDLPNGLLLHEDAHPQPALPLPARARAGFLLALGRAVESKGFEDLLQALILLREQGTPLPHLLLAAGSLSRFPTRHQGRLHAMISKYKLDATFLPQFSTAYQTWLRSPALRAVVVPSRSEPFGRIPLDAFAVGAAPVVATRTGGLAETVIDGETGFTAEPRNPASLAAAIRRALHTGPQERARLRRAGRDLLERRHDYGVTIRSYVHQHLSWALEAAPDHEAAS
jgi:glycosyltransferase involved in cell wall biosynthesis